MELCCLTTFSSPKSAVLPPWKEGGKEAMEVEEVPGNLVRNGLFEPVIKRSSELGAVVKGSWYGGGGGSDGGGAESTVPSEVC